MPLQFYDAVRLTRYAFRKKCCTYLRDAEGGQAELLFGQRTFRVVMGEL
jgi:hypothetical protein